MARKRSFFVEKLPEADRLILSGGQARHLNRVLRLKPGARVVVYDASGKARHAEVETVAHKTAELRLLDEAGRAPLPSIEIHVYPSIVRPAAMEKLIVMCSELGAASITPVMTARSRSRTPGKEKLERWKRLAVESSRQCGRAAVMEIGEPVKFDHLDPSGMKGLKIILHGGAISMLAAEQGPEPGLVHILIGPEGGWELSELQAALDGGFEPVDLGPRTLRSETASVASVVMVQMLFGDLLIR